MNIRIYSYQKNDTNIIRTNIHIGKYSNVRIHSYQIFDISSRFDARGWIFDVWYNRKLKYSWHNKIEVIFLWTLIFVWTIWAIYLLDLLAQTLDFSLEYILIKKRDERISEYICIKKTIRMNIRVYSHQKMIRIWYERIFVPENIRIYSNIRIFATPCSLLTSTDSLLNSTDSLLTSTDSLLTSTDLYWHLLTLYWLFFDVYWLSTNFYWLSSDIYWLSSDIYWPLLTLY